MCMCLVLKPEFEAAQAGSSAWSWIESGQHGPALKTSRLTCCVDSEPSVRLAAPDVSPGRMAQDLVEDESPDADRNPTNSLVEYEAMRSGFMER
jgi:hypothetical protein